MSLYLSATNAQKKPTINHIVRKLLLQINNRLKLYLRVNNLYFNNIKKDTLTYKYVRRTEYAIN